MSVDSPEYILLARHGSVRRDSWRSDVDQRLSERGAADTRQVARRLASWIEEQPRADLICVSRILHSKTEHSRETAEIYLRALRSVKRDDADLPQPEIGEDPSLAPKAFWESRGGEATEELVKRMRERVDSAMGNAVLVVGHQPQLSWIVGQLVKTRIPIRRSELLCVQLRRSKWIARRRGRLAWSIGLSDPTTMTQLRDKIRSKMDVAKILGAFILPGLGIALGSLLDPAKLATLQSAAGPGVYPREALFLAAGLLLLSVILYLATLYAYDRLLMPVGLWSEVEAAKDRAWLVQRPPSSADWILYQNMLRVWTWLFTPATVAVVGGLLSLGYAVFRPGPLWDVLVLLGVAAILVWLYLDHFRPVLGSED